MEAIPSGSKDSFFRGIQKIADLFNKDQVAPATTSVWSAWHQFRR